MSKKIWIIILVVVVVLAVYVGSTYNRLISSNESLDTSWAQVEAQYQRRFDLIPNLVNSVKGAMKQEQTVFDAITEARTRYSGATTPDAKASAATGVESAFSRLLVVMENYPELKSVENVQTLMAQIEGTENRVSVERGRFNESVKSYNLIVKRFPSSVIASMFGFSGRSYFESVKEADNAPSVNF